MVPEKMEESVRKITTGNQQVVPCKVGEKKEVRDITLEAVPAYNNLKPFHPKRNGWLGYLLTIDDAKVYIAGDTDLTKDNQNISCDIALVPIGGTYTMDAKTAAKLVNEIQPKVAIPMHYGSVAGNIEDEKTFAAAVNEGTEVVIKMQKY